MNKTLIITVASTLLILSNFATAGDIAAGKELSVKCMSCHGVDGISSNPTAPNVAGKDIAYLADKIHAYQDGSIDNPLMKSMVGSLSATDIDNLASYYNSLSGQ